MTGWSIALIVVLLPVYVVLLSAAAKLGAILMSAWLLMRIDKCRDKREAL